MLWLSLFGCEPSRPTVSTWSLTDVLGGEIEVEATAWQGDGLDVVLQLSSPLLSGAVPLEVVWTTGDVVFAGATFAGGLSDELTLQLPDPCDTLRLEALFAVVRDPLFAWSTTVELALDGEVVSGGSVVDLSGGRVAVCGSSPLVRLQVPVAGPYRFDRRGGPGFIVRAGEASANLPSAMNLPAGAVDLEALAPVSEPYELVVSAM